MAETWNPTGNPVHFLIEMGDMLGGSYLRFRSATTVDMPRCRAELDAVQDGVMAWANVGSSRELLVNRAVAWWVNRYKDAGQATNHDEITSLVVARFINAFVAMCHIRPAVHPRDLSGTTGDARAWRVETFNAQNRGFELLGRARSDAFARLARLGITVPACVAGRSVAGDVPGGVAFHDLSAELPAYVPDHVELDVAATKDQGRRTVDVTPPDGPFGIGGFRFGGVEVDFSRAPKRTSLVLALWDAQRSALATARDIEDVLAEVYGENDEGTDEKFRQLCADTRQQFQKVHCPLDILNRQGKVQLVPLTT